MSDPVFILGMPRCRTAWLSVCLSALGVDCSHEGMRDFATFAEYASELDARLEAGPAGDSDPGLVYWLAEILERWPGARFAVVSRDDCDALEATVKVAPMAEGLLRLGWNGYTHAFKSASDLLRARGCARFYSFERLASADLLEWLSGVRPSRVWLARRERLKVTSRIEAGLPVSPPRQLQPDPEISLQGLNVSGLTAAQFSNADFETVAAWWSEHNGETLNHSALPPLGVVVSDAAGPCAAAWCFECYGVPVAEIAFPVTRPGLTPAGSRAALAYAIATCVHAAGKGYEPPAVFRHFKALAPVATVPFLKRLGFRESRTERTAMVLSV